MAANTIQDYQKNWFQPRTTDYRSAQAQVIPAVTAPVATETANAENPKKSVAHSANNGTAVQQPVRNIFGKGMTIEQRQANADANSRATDNQFLQSVATDNLERQRQAQDQAQYDTNMANGTYASHENWAFAPRQGQYNTNNVENFQNQQQSQPTYGVNPKDVPNSSANTAQKEPATWEELRDYLYGSEAEKEKEANNKAKVQAVGDALRHIGNLATTAWGHATPQQYKTSPAQQTLDTYKTERDQRDAKAYSYWNGMQKQKQQEIENELKKSKAERQAQKDAESNAKWEAEFKLKVQKAEDDKEAKLSKAKTDAERQKANDDYREKMYQLQVDRFNWQKTHGGSGGGRGGSSSSRSSSGSGGGAGKGGYDNNRFVTFYGNVSRKKSLSSTDIISIYNDFKKKGWLDKDDNADYGGYEDEDKSVSNINMLKSIITSAGNDNNKHKEEISRALVDKYGFVYDDPDTAKRRRNNVDAHRAINKQRADAANKKREEEKKSRNKAGVKAKEAKPNASVTAPGKVRGKESSTALG